MINELINRNSVRNYREQPIENDKINKLKEVINASPTTMNFQSFSAIFVTDPVIKNELMKLNWNHQHVGKAPLVIVFVADLNRIKTLIDSQSSKISTQKWDSYVTALIDATIAATTAMTAAMDLGLGTCFIGGLRWNSEASNKLLHVEGDATVVLGLTVGYEDGKSIHRPKVNKVYDKTYDIKRVKDELMAYDLLMKEYYKNIFNKDTNFSKISVESLKKIDATQGASNLSKKFKL